MKKAIIVISGTPSSKSAFEEIAKETCWIWNINLKKFLRDVSRNNFYWNGEEEEKDNKFISELFSFLNKRIDFEEKYIRQSIEKFNLDNSEYKKYGDNKIFSRFILLIHGISQELMKKLEDEFGVFQLHITSRKLNTVPEMQDYVLYEDDPNFKEETRRVLNILIGKEE